MRIGIDLGGTKVAAVALDDAGRELARARCATPRAYGDTVAGLAAVVATLERETGARAQSVGVGLPGVVNPHAGTVRAANLPWLDGHPLAADVAAALGRPVRLGNDANCFVLSEATDGAAADASVVFGIILGTGVGGGLVVDRRILAGRNALAGEWGHVPFPWRQAEDGAAHSCGCGRQGCVETMLNGAGLVRLHKHRTGEQLEAHAIGARVAAGDAAALGTLSAFADALARALAMIVNVLDPDVVVIGGGLSGLPGLSHAVQARLGAWALASSPRTAVRPARHGAESGQRGAAWL